MILASLVVSMPIPVIIIFLDCYLYMLRHKQRVYMSVLWSLLEKITFECNQLVPSYKNKPILTDV